MAKLLSRVWIATAVLLLLLATSDIIPRRSARITDLFFRYQDLPILIAITIAAAALLILASSGPRTAARLGRIISNVPTAWVAKVARPAIPTALAVFTAAIAYAGSKLVFDNYPLSMDEFLATFDATILGRGQTMAPIAQQWRAYAPALQPMFMLPMPGHAFWVSGYLPVNAILRALAGKVGAAALLNPALAALSVVSVFGIGRRLWPDKFELALVAATLLATSSQFMVTAMTPYSMTAHLALNLVWLWLFLRGDRLGHTGAILVAFLACGLHQLIFHPLFAAPFVFQLWLERRWVTATLYTAAYGLICLFWSLYWPFALALAGAAPAAGSHLGIQWLASRAADLVVAFDPAKISILAKNLIRFITWQNPLSVPLAIVSLVGAVRAKETLRSLALGLILTTLAMFVLLPYQGHGWGYRYLHGILGSVCLLAAFAWGGFTDALDGPEKAAARTAFVVVAVISFGVLAPIRALQAHRFAQPYAAAEIAIRHANTQIVLVVDSGIWFGEDLVRNDPYLGNRPLVLNYASLDEARLRYLRSRYSVSLFDRADARRVGIRTFDAPEE